MKTIVNNIENSIEINKSKFICFLIKVTSIDEVSFNLNQIKNKYKGATHYCYAYILDNNKKCSDDKEPSGTAGLPILNVLEKNELNNILCVVVRYFGGIKLGSGGLLRAYSNSVVLALNETKLNDILYGKKVKFEFDYDKTKEINNLFLDKDIIYKEFNDKIIYEIKIDNIKYEEIISKLKEISNVIDISDIII